jgi:hypothetical protein
MIDQLDIIGHGRRASISIDETASPAGKGVILDSDPDRYGPLFPLRRKLHRQSKIRLWGCNVGAPADPNIGLDGIVLLFDLASYLRCEVSCPKDEISFRDFVGGDLGPNVGVRTVASANVDGLAIAPQCMPALAYNSQPSIFPRPSPANFIALESERKNATALQIASLLECYDLTRAGSVAEYLVRPELSLELGDKTQLRVLFAGTVLEVRNGAPDVASAFPVHSDAIGRVTEILAELVLL